MPRSELDVSFSTSGGPGGQHANKAATRAEARFDVEASPSLTPGQRERLLDAFVPTVVVVVDDMREGISLIVRGADLLGSTGRQRALAANVSRCANSSCSTSSTDKPPAAATLRQPMRAAALGRTRGRVKLGASV